MRTSVQHWIRENLFATKLDAALSLLFIPVCIGAAARVVHWAFQLAEWKAVTDNLGIMLAGTYPRELIWRPWVATLILCFLAGATLAAVSPIRKLTASSIVLALVAVVVVLAAMGFPNGAWTSACIGVAALGWVVPLQHSRARAFIAAGWGLGLIAICLVLLPGGIDRWGGLLMSVLFTIFAAGLSVPFGVVLALGRRSRYASARVICTGYIEFMRSLPLILIVYWIWIISPLLAPEHSVPDLIRGLVGFVLFFAAYVAEYVRSGLQSIPRGQLEAARSLGMSNYHVNIDIVLPQATRVVMPALVGNVLDIFNTAPLLFIIGLTDFLRAGQMILVNPQTSGHTYEIYSFMFVICMAISSVITFGTRRLEVRMDAGTR